MAKRATKEPVGVIMRRPLETDKGSHFLFITRSSGDPFARGMGTAIFAADTLDLDVNRVCARTEQGDIMFSKDTPFLFIPRTLCRPVGIKELAKIQIDEKVEWDKAYKDMPTDEPAAASEEEYRPGNYVTARDAYLRRTYGITQKRYVQMFKAQKGVCFICLQPPKAGKNLHVDHNHKTGVVRGLLCWKCNHRFLGRSRENVEHHKRAVIYLSRNIDWRYA